MKNNFKVGDRVAAYESGGRWAGVIETIKDGIITIRCEKDPIMSVTEGYKIEVCEKQCRRLVKKKRREIWIECQNSGMSATNNKLDQRVSLFGDHDGRYSRFVEAKK